jgi:hypothetical protein
MSNLVAQAQTVANALSGEKAFETVRFAITGDACADLMSAMLACADRSGFSARQVQLIFECYAALYKESADQHDRDWRDWQQKQRMGDPEQPCAPPGSYAPAIGTIDALEEERKAAMLARWESAKAIIQKGDVRFPRP